MKKITILSFLILSLFVNLTFTSCKEDEPKDLIVGTWEQAGTGTILIFNEGGTSLISGVSGTWSVAGNTLTLNTLGELSRTITIFTISEKSMVLIYPEYPEVKVSYTKK